MMLKAGMVSDNSNAEAADRLSNTVEYMKSEEYRRSREPKQVEQKEHVYMKGPDTGKVGENKEEVDIIDDDDHELAMLRARRMKAMKDKAEKAKHLKTQGHGMYREIDEKEFLPEVTSTQFVACHFYHSEFKRCDLMHDKLGEISGRVVQIKFVKINAQEAPFFSEKLGITVLPCVVLFKDGVAMGRIQGFDGLSYGDNFPTSRLEKRVCKAFGVDMSSDGLDEDAADDWAM